MCLKTNKRCDTLFLWMVGSNILKQFHADMPTINREPIRTTPNMELRDYQITISDNAARCVQQYGLAYLSMQTRTGKTITAFETCRKIGVSNVLFVTKKKAIKSIEKDYENYKDHFKCTVINYESVSKVKGSYDIVICDESHACLLGNTIIDGEYIRNVKVGDLHKTYNTQTKEIELNRVSRVYKNKLTENIIKIKANGREIICTESHLLYTKRGWIEACKIKSTDFLCMVW